MQNELKSKSVMLQRKSNVKYHIKWWTELAYRRGSLALSEIGKLLSAEMDRVHYRLSYKRNPRGILDRPRNPKCRLQVESGGEVGRQMWRVQAWYCSSKFHWKAFLCCYLSPNPVSKTPPDFDTMFVILNKIVNLLALYFSWVIL